MSPWPPPLPPRPPPPAATAAGARPRKGRTVAARPLFDGPIVRRALREALGKLDPHRMIRNPVMFVVEIGSAFTTLLFVHALVTGAGEAPAGFIGAIALWLWFTVLFANFAEAMAEGRGKAQADSLRKARRDVPAIVVDEPRRDARRTERPSSQLRAGDIVLVESGQIIPGDGEIARGRRLGQRERHHRRERAGDP